MCGILGWVSLDGAPPPKERLELALRSLDHRGPDGRASWSDGSCWLGHTRLSILDLSANGRQPMPSPDGRYQIAYNGEFYNYRDHAALVESKGYRLGSSGDTAVLLGLYSIFGAEALKRVNGMFALAIWDAKERRLFLARDRMGKKPLYYAIDRKRLCFASELKALTPLLDDRRLDPAALDAYFALGYVPAPLSIYKEVRKLEPSAFMTVDGAGPRLGRYWSPQAPTAEDATEEHVEELLTDSIRQRLVSDVPVGVFLSGGIDSSLIAALAAKRLGKSLKAYCIGAGPGFYDERPYAEIVAKHCGLELETESIEASPRSLLDRVLPFLDEPFADSSALPTFAVCEMASRHGKVVLSGEGGDEVFGGYDKYQRFLSVSSFRGLPSFLRRLMSLPGWAADESRLSWLRSGVRLARHSLTDDMTCFAAFNSQLPAPSRRRLFQRSFHAQFCKDNAAYFAPYAEEGFEDYSLRKALAVDRKTYLPGDLLFKADRMSMAHSLEVRCPFLDYRLVELSLRIPERDLIHGSRTKVLLRKIAAKYLPREIIERPKKGFSVPMSRWMRTEFAELFLATVRPDPELEEIFDYTEIRRMFDRHRDGREEWGNQLWTMMMFHLWKARFTSNLGFPEIHARSRAF